MTPETQQPAEPFESAYAHDRWQGPSFAASWISPPAPQRVWDEDAEVAARDGRHA